MKGRKSKSAAKRPVKGASGSKTGRARSGQGVPAAGIALSCVEPGDMPGRENEWDQEAGDGPDGPDSDAGAEAPAALC